MSPKTAINTIAKKALWQNYKTYCYQELNIALKLNPKKHQLMDGSTFVCNAIIKDAFDKTILPEIEPLWKKHAGDTPQFRKAANPKLREKAAELTEPLCEALERRLEEKNQQREEDNKALREKNAKLKQARKNHIYL